MKKTLVCINLLFLSLFFLNCSSNDNNNFPETTSPNNPLFTSGNGITDIDNNFYSTIIVNNQEWMQKNLNVSKYKNGDLIPQVDDPSVWANLTTGAWCYYNNDSSNGPIYGKLYNWYAVNDVRGLAPLGYHIPTDLEWTTFTNYLGGATISGGKMKEIGTIHWIPPNTVATNTSGFTGLPGGYRDYTGAFNNLGNVGEWWSSTQYTTLYAINRRIIFNEVYTGLSNDYKVIGFSVRCVKN